jgi:hypothetical protein
MLSSVGSGGIVRPVCTRLLWNPRQQSDSFAIFNRPGDSGHPVQTSSCRGPSSSVAAYTQSRQQGGQERRSSLVSRRSQADRGPSCVVCCASSAGPDRPWAAARACCTALRRWSSVPPRGSRPVARGWCARPVCGLCLVSLIGLLLVKSSVIDHRVSIKRGRVGPRGPSTLARCCTNLSKILRLVTVENRDKFNSGLE